MPSIRKKVDLAASGSDDNALSGNRYEFLPVDSLVRVYAVAQDDGGGSTNIKEGEVTLTFSLSNAVLLDNIDVPISTSGPNRNEHLLSEEIGAAGDRIIISSANSDAVNAADLILLVDVVPIG